MKEQLRAVDIVIVPPEEVQEIAIDLSKKLKDSSFVLGKTEFVPHISLFMGYSEDIDQVKLQIKEALAGEFPFEIQAKGVEGFKGPHIKFSDNKNLYRLHQRLVSLVNLENNGVEKEYYVEGKANEESLKYLAMFRKRHSKANFEPHITLGDGIMLQVADGETFPISFEASRVGLFHLGDHNTCRKLLGEWELGK